MRCGSVGRIHPPEQFYGVTYGNGYFVAVGAAKQAGLPPTPLIKTSTDGTNWISRTVEGTVGVNGSLYGVAFGKNTFVAVGQSTIYQSDDVAQPAFLTQEMGQAPDGHMRLVIQSSPGDRIAVESSGDLADWRPLATVTNLTGVARLTDSGGQNLSQRFYRVRLAAP